MAYIDIITLTQAKNYLKIDDTLTQDDNLITSMIEAAFNYIENWTNVMVVKREKDYVMVDGFLRVYDFPINALVDPLEIDNVQKKTLYTNYLNNDLATIDMTLDVGIELPADVPQALINVAYEIIDLMYYEHINGKQYTKDLTTLSTTVLNQFKRFIL